MIMQHSSMDGAQSRRRHHGVSLIVRTIYVSAVPVQFWVIGERPAPPCQYQPQNWGLPALVAWQMNNSYKGCRRRSCQDTSDKKSETSAQWLTGLSNCLPPPVLGGPTHSAFIFWIQIESGKFGGPSRNTSPAYRNLQISSCTPNWGLWKRGYSTCPSSIVLAVPRPWNAFTGNYSSIIMPRSKSHEQKQFDPTRSRCLILIRYQC